MTKITYKPTDRGLSVKLDGRVVGRIVTNAPLRPGDPHVSPVKMRYRYIPKGAWLGNGGSDYLSLAECKVSIAGEVTP